jgi:DNA (cytosine-5)-methyltransferase 1
MRQEVHNVQQTYLSTFSGCGLGDLAHQRLATPRRRCVGYVECDVHAQQTLLARIDDGSLQPAPVFGDIRDFARLYASEYAGLVDLVAGGFPCQPFSKAGGRRADDDLRNMWPALCDVLRVVGPGEVNLENVPALLAPRRDGGRLVGGDDAKPRRERGHVAQPRYFGRVLSDLDALGYDAGWGVLSALAVGAPHQRHRLWVVAKRRA